MTDPLTDSERDVLTGAARRPDGRIHPLPEDVDADPIVGKLVSLDLIERVPDERPATEPFLRINYKGLKALHAGPDERATAARPTAVEAFIAAKLEFDDLLERLKDKSDDHFDVDPRPGCRIIILSVKCNALTLYFVQPFGSVGQFRSPILR